VILPFWIQIHQDRCKLLSLAGMNAEKRVDGFNQDEELSSAITKKEVT
jgi:hypothetical protein